MRFINNLKGQMALKLYFYSFKLFPNGDNTRRFTW
jgi:hypothetical protein